MSQCKKERVHGVSVRTMALRMTRSLRMQAVMITLNGLPAALRRSASSEMALAVVRALEDRFDSGYLAA